MLVFLRAMSMRMLLSRRILLVTKASNMIHRNWWFYKFRFAIRQALLKQQVEVQVQTWLKMLLPPQGKSI